MIVVIFLVAMIKSCLSATLEIRKQRPAEQVLIAIQNINGFSAVIINVQMAWSHKKLTNRGRNSTLSCSLPPTMAPLVLGSKLAYFRSRRCQCGSKGFWCKQG